MKPFLKWAGNKYQIIQRIKALLPPAKRFIEPFCGSAAVFLNTSYSENLIADSNPHLIQTYLYLQNEGDNFIEYCAKLFTAENNHEERFYAFRKEFNHTSDLYRKSALFIYLNKHCFNGLCRFNSKGEFNTPFGKYKQPYFPYKEMQYFHEKSKTAIFKTSDYVSIFAEAKEQDVIYCDPPYVPLSDTAKFTNYSSEGFNFEHQIQLAELATKTAASQGSTVIISNHYTEVTREIYKNAHVITFPVQRFISCKGENRGKAEEMLAIFNLKDPRTPL